ncbi:hypothetical protein E4T42_00227 [Aureobasidium subglaciale]|nr:hypothetical protein E4T42_00227 [Aureobasidium subglaciale]
MYAARPIARSSIPRTLRSARVPRNTQARFQSSSSSSSSSTGTNSHVVTGLASGTAVAVVGYTIYALSPAGRMSRKINGTAKDAYVYYNDVTSKIQANTPDADDAINYVKEFAYSYVAWIPGGRKYVDTAFKDLDTLRQNHKDDVDKIIRETYSEFQEVSKNGFSRDSLTKAMEALSNLSQKIGALAADAAQDLMDNHPQLKEQVGPRIEQLKSMGDQYGPEVKQEVDRTWGQVKEVMAGGLSVANINKARQIVEEKYEKVKQLGDQAWQKGLDQAKPYFDKNPKIKELIENNADALKQGNAKELFEKVKSGVESGSTGDLEGYVNKAVEKAKSKGSEVSSQWGFGGLDQYLKMIPSGGEILPKLQQLKEVAEKHKTEGEKLLNETMEELKKVLEKQSSKAQDIVEQAKKDAK